MIREGWPQWFGYDGDHLDPEMFGLLAALRDTEAVTINGSCAGIQFSELEGEGHADHTMVQFTSLDDAQVGALMAAIVREATSERVVAGCYLAGAYHPDEPSVAYTLTFRIADLSGCDEAARSQLSVEEQRDELSTAIQTAIAVCRDGAWRSHTPSAER